VEIMTDGSTVYLDTLAMIGHIKLSRSMNRSKCPIATMRPSLIYRTT